MLERKNNKGRIKYEDNFNIRNRHIPPTKNHLKVGQVNSVINQNNEQTNETESGSYNPKFADPQVQEDSSEHEKYAHPPHHNPSPPLQVELKLHHDTTLHPQPTPSPSLHQMNNQIEKHLLHYETETKSKDNPIIYQVTDTPPHTAPFPSTSSTHHNTEYTHRTPDLDKKEETDRNTDIRDELEKLISETMEIKIRDDNTLGSAELNTMKFPKPRIKVENTYKSKHELSTIERMHKICQHIDNNHQTNEEKEFYEKATDFVTNKGKKKLTDRNKRATVKKAELKNKLAERDIIETNTMTFKAGDFRKVQCTLGKRNLLQTHGLIDTGASHTCIPIDTLHKIDYEDYEEIKMSMSSAGAQDDENNVIAKTKIEVTIKDIENIDRHFHIKALVLRNCNNHAIILGADTIFNKSASQITNDKWIMTHKDTGRQIEIPLKIVPIKTQHNDKIMRNKKYNNNSEKLDLNSLQTEVPEKDTDKYEKEFEDFLNNPPNIRNANLQNQNQTEKTFSESLKDIHRENKEHVLEDNYCENILPQDTQTILNKDYIDEEYTLGDIKTNHIPKKYRRPLQELCKKYEDIFSKNNFDMGKTSLIKHKIEIESIPPYQTKRFISTEKEEFARKACEKLEMNNIIDESVAPQCISNLVLIAKFDGIRDNSKASKIHQDKSDIKKFRLAQDLRLLNQCTINVKRTNAVHIDNFISKIKGKIVSQLDLTQAFFAIELEELAQELTTFYLGDRKMKWKRMSQGLINAPATFEKLMMTTFSKEFFEEIIQKDDINKKLKKIGKETKSYEDFLQRYVDDLFPHSDDYESHLIHLEIIFLAIRRANLRLNPKKCMFLSKQIKVLGYELKTDDTELFLDKEKAQAILDWNLPSSLYELQSRLYSIAYFTKFLPQIKRIIYPLIHLLRTKEFQWTEIHNDAWLNLKTLIKLDIRLTVPKKHEQLFLFTDSSKLSCAQILFVERNNQLHVVATHSQIFNYLDSRKNIYIREGISLVLGIKKFRHYMESSDKDTIIYTDCQSLLYNGRTKDHNIAAAQISNFLAKTSQELKFSIYHAKGQNNFLADLFSRAYQNSRLIGAPSLSKEQAQKLPPLPTHFIIDQDELYQFLCSPLEPENKQNRNRKKTQYERPTQSLITMLRNTKPEQREISATRLKLQNNDETIKKNELTKQITQKEEKTRKHFAEKAERAMLNHFEINEKEYLDIDTPKHTDNLNTNTKKLKQDINQKTDPGQDTPPKRHIKTMDHELSPRQEKIFYEDERISNKNTLLPGREATQSEIPPNTETKKIYIDTKILNKRDTKIEIEEGQTIDIEKEVILFGETPFRIINKRPDVKVNFYPTKSLYKSNLTLTNLSKEKLFILPYTQLYSIRTNENIEVIPSDEKIDNPLEFYPPNTDIKIHEKPETDIIMMNNIDIKPQKESEERPFNGAQNKTIKGKIADFIQDSDKMKELIIQSNQDTINDNSDNYIENIKIMQNNDPECQRVLINWPSDEKESQKYPYIQISDILYRKHDKRYLLVLPSLILKPLIYHLHHKLCHPSKTLLNQHMKLYYSHPAMTKIIENIEEKCFTCMTIKPSIKNTKSSGNERTFIPTKPRQAWSFDLIMNLPKTNKGKTGYLLATCIASRYCNAYLLKDKTQSEIYNAVLQHLYSYGKPQLIYSDSDPALIKPITDLQKIFLFHYKTSLPGQQQQNLVENSYKTLKSTITKQIYDEKNDFTRQNWDTALQLALQAYNKLPIKKMNFTKEEIFYRFTTNDTLFSLQDEIEEEEISNELREYMINKGKDRKKDTTRKKLEIGQIIYIKHDLPPIIGSNQAYKQTHRGPLKIIENNKTQKHVIARELDSNKYFHIAYDRIFTIEKAYEIPCLLSQTQETILYQNIRKANTNNEKPQLNLDRYLNEKYDKKEVKKM